ncbi:syndetin [Diachasma alloeum]|uniref:syndetin n=1 Tax=Diachasma alloeum TaxID=454923 RepID=UPI0007385019|nr:syndetin [Diachasma alloeum]
MDRNKLGLSVKNSIMMEDLKFKFLGLINKQNQPKIPSMGLNPELLNPVDSYRHDLQDDVKSEASQSTEGEAVPDQDILESIESSYYETDGTFDSCRHELKKLPDQLNCKDIERHYKRLKQQQQVVSKKVLQLILQQQSACNDEFQEILKLLEQLRDVLEICRMGRFDLNLAKKQFTTASLGILANYRKRQTVQQLLNSLNTIKTLQKTEDRLQELLKEENYPGAISLLLECQSAAQTYKHFHCVAALHGKLQDTLEQTEETLDHTLSRICLQFDTKTYTSVQEAYKLLGKTQTAIDQLHMHFTAAIHNTAFSAVHSYAGGDIKRQYKQICQSIPRDSQINCLIDLSKSLWRIVCSYHQVLSWHKSNPSSPEAPDPSKNLEETFSNQYIKQKLENGMTRIWHDVEIKICTFLTATDLTSLKFEQFVQVLGIINRLMEVGEELCGSKTENLQKTMRNQCSLYFSHYHVCRLDELRIFLEHDGWELCPVKSTFVATQLQEFKSLRPALINCRSPDGSSDHDNSVFGWIQRYLETDVSPFDVGMDETMDEDILANNMSLDISGGDYSEVSSEEETEVIEEGSKRRKRKRGVTGPMVTNTTLSVLRVCGRYLQMSRLLRSIAVTVTQSMIQFFELYFYAIHNFFTSDLEIASDSLYSPILKLTLARIRENLILAEGEGEEEGGKGKRSLKIQQPMLSMTVDLSRGERLFGLAERIVAVESIVFLGAQYESLKSYLERLIKEKEERGFLNQFYGQTIASAVDLRKPVYMAVVSRAFDVAGVLNLMGKVNWEVRDVMSQHSAYVDKILKEVLEMKRRLEEVGGILPLVEEVKAAIWENVGHLVTHTLVEGFSNAKKCSNGGRGLMQLDYTQLKSNFEILTSVRPMPHSEYVETYIKAYYIAENILEEWVKEHKEYSVKHLIGLISCACQNNKKSRQRLISIVEEQRPNR